MKITKLMSTVAAIALLGSTALYAGAPHEPKDENVKYDESQNTAAGVEVLNNFEFKKDGTTTNASQGNTIFGYRAGNAVVADVAYTGWNTLIGKEAGLMTTVGTQNTFVGVASGLFNTTGKHNTYLGSNSGSHSEGSRNVFVGFDAGSYEMGNDMLYISNSDTNTPLIYGDFNITRAMVAINGKLEVNGAPDANVTLDVNGTIAASWSGSNTVDDGLTNLLTLDANNSDGATSDAGFGLRNTKADFQWNFRTGQNGEAFIATKAGNGGADFQVLSGASHTDAEMMVGDVTIFKEGQLVNDEGNALKDVIAALEARVAALEAK